MKVFFSWSGTQSRYIAETLCEWIQQVLQAVDPWVSSDIEKGKRWSDEISGKLSESKVAIVCLTKHNLKSPWVHFECGAISKSPGSLLCTFLFKITPTDVKQPLSAFQHTVFAKDEVLDLVKSINLKLQENGQRSLKDAQIESIFSTFWPQLEAKLTTAPDEDEKDPSVPARTDRDLLEESLQLLRSIKTDTSSPSFPDTELNEVVDYHLDRFATARKIDAYDLKGMEDDVVEVMLKVPDIKLIFRSNDSLKKRIKERISQLMPY